MGNLTVRNLDDNVIDQLKETAKVNHRSLEAEVRHRLTESVYDSAYHARAAEFFERTRRLAKGTIGTPQSDSTLLIREDRDR